MTATAMRPEAGLGERREVSRLSVAQASALILALSVVLRALQGFVLAEEVGVAFRKRQPHFRLSNLPGSPWMVKVGL
jgi:hypothetical protein